MREKNQEGDININGVHQTDVDVLLACGATKKWSHQRMNRPTDTLEIKTSPPYELFNPSENHIPEFC